MFDERILIYDRQFNGVKCKHVFLLHYRKQRLLYIRYVRIYFICLLELRIESNLLWVCLIAFISCACDDFFLTKCRENFSRETII